MALAPYSQHDLNFSNKQQYISNLLLEAEKLLLHEEFRLGDQVARTYEELKKYQNYEELLSLDMASKSE